MVTYLAIGGPAHGQEREVSNGQSEITIMAPSPGNPLPTPWSYVVREIEAETLKGHFRRNILVEKNMPVEVAAQALASVLLQSFAEQLMIQYMEGGERINGTDTEDNQPGSNQSGLLIAKR